MLAENGHDHVQYHLKLDGSCRLRFPTALRKRLGVAAGDPILLSEQDGMFILETSAQSLKRAQEYFAGVLAADISLVDELLDERRQEAAGE